MMHADSKEFIEFGDIWEEIVADISKDTWIVCEDHTSTKESGTDRTIQYKGTFSYLVEEDFDFEKTLTTTQWDLLPDEARPQLVGWRDNEEYNRYGNRNGIVPVVIRRNFHGIRANYSELLEEIRHYFNCYHPSIKEPILRVYDDGHEEKVAYQDGNAFFVRASELLEFMNISKRHLVVCYEYRRFSSKSLGDLGAEDTHKMWNSDDGMVEIVIKDYDPPVSSHAAFSMIRAKKVIRRDTIPTLSIQKPYCDFIIDRVGSKDVTNTCDPEQLDNYFSKNPGAPHFLTPVFFTRDVLKRYIDQPDKYEISDGQVVCGGLWDLPIDNDLSGEFVTAYLGDLGQRLSAREQLFWRPYNVAPPQGNKISKTKLRRDFLAIPTDPESKEFHLSKAIEQLNDAWKSKFGSVLFKPFDRAVQRLAHDNKKAINEEVLALAIMLNDSINVSELRSYDKSVAAINGSVNVLGKFLENNLNVSSSDELVLFFRRLNTLRTGAAHREAIEHPDKRYEKTTSHYKVDGDYRAAFDRIVADAVATLEQLKDTCV